MFVLKLKEILICNILLIYSSQLTLPNLIIFIAHAINSLLKVYKLEVEVYKLQILVAYEM